MRQMSKEKRKLWLDAAIVLSKNSNVVSNCPECKTGILKVKDEPITSWSKIDRYIYCDNCKRVEVITMNDPKNNLD